MASSFDLDAALVALLAGDAALAAAMPDGVWIDTAPANLRNFVLLGRLDHIDSATFDGGRAIEDALYFVKAVSLSTSAAAALTAAARIEALLEDQAITVAGYGWMSTAREKPIRDVEVDDLDASIRWQHIGGWYRVQMAPQ
jgi:hypothetical protein